MKRLTAWTGTLVAAFFLAACEREGRDTEVEEELRQLGEQAREVGRDVGKEAREAGRDVRREVGGFGAPEVGDFSRWDQNGDGAIDRNEFNAMYRSLDRDGNGRIDAREFRGEQ